MRQLVDDNGQVYLSWPDGGAGKTYEEPTCITIVDGDVEANKRLMLPTDKAVSAGDAGVVYFHPLSENIIRGESEVLKCIRNMVRWRINATALTVMEVITELATAETHTKMSAQQQVVLKIFANATSKIDKDIKNVLDRYLNKIIGIYLKRKHTIDGETYRRVASVTFPLRGMITKGSKMVGEFEMSSLKNADVLAGLLDYVFPNSDDPILWSAGSNSNVAPYYESLLLVYCHVAERLNKIIKLFKKHIPDADQLLIPTEFKGSLQNLEEWKSVMRPLEHNIGAVLKGEREQSTGMVEEQRQSIARHASAANATSVNVTQPPAVVTQPVHQHHTVGNTHTVAQPQQGPKRVKTWQEIKAENSGMNTGQPNQQYNPNLMLSQPAVNNMMTPQMQQLMMSQMQGYNNMGAMNAMMPMNYNMGTQSLQNQMGYNQNQLGSFSIL